MQEIGRFLIGVGLAVTVIGLIIWFAGDKFSWFGNLPGDIKIEKEKFKFYFPITTMVIISVALSALVWLFRKLF